MLHRSWCVRIAPGAVVRCTPGVTGARGGRATRSASSGFSSRHRSSTVTTICPWEIAPLRRRPDEDRPQSVDAGAAGTRGQPAPDDGHSALCVPDTSARNSGRCGSRRTRRAGGGADDHRADRPRETDVRALPHDLAMAYTAADHRAAAQGRQDRLADRRRGGTPDQQLPRRAGVPTTISVRAT